MSGFKSDQALIGSTWLYHNTVNGEVTLPGSIVQNGNPTRGYKVDLGTAMEYILDQPNYIAPKITLPVASSDGYSTQCAAAIIDRESIHRVKFLVHNPSAESITTTIQYQIRLYKFSYYSISQLKLEGQLVPLDNLLPFPIKGAHSLEAELLWGPVGNSNYLLQIVSRYISGPSVDTFDISLYEKTYRNSELGNPATTFIDYTLV